MPEKTYRPEHCPTCECSGVGPLPAGMAADAYCPEHGSEPTAYSDCSCFPATSHHPRNDETTEGQS